MLQWLQQPVTIKMSDAPQHYSVVSDGAACWYFKQAECSQ